jgi:hypothetical protein
MLALAAISRAESPCGWGCYGDPCDAQDCQYGYYYREVGPELTGDYSRQYLQSWHTGQTYADPMYYYGQGSVRRWRAIRPFTGGKVTKKVYRYERRMNILTGTTQTIGLAPLTAAAQ